jgi:single-strand DNA-binding protein
MSNVTTLTLKYLSHNAPDPTRKRVDIAARIWTADEGQSFDILVTSYQGMPELSIPQTQITYLLVIGELQVVRSEEGNDSLSFIADVIQHLPQMPNWDGHPMANAIALQPIAYSHVVGNVGQVNDRDRLRQVGDRVVCNRSMAVKHNRSKTETTWFKVDFWDKLGESVADPYLSKGARFATSGPLKFNSYATKTGGNIRIEPTVIARNLELIGSKRDDNPSSFSTSNGGGSSYAAPAPGAVAPPPAAAISFNPEFEDAPF